MAEERPSLAELFRFQAEQAVGRSPRYAELCRRFADDPNVAAIVETPPRWDAPLRLLSGLHYLVLSGAAEWDSISDALVTHRDFLGRFVGEQAVQTNEVQRCWMLLPCFLEAARRTGAGTFDVIELGASAGLNLGWDSYRYRYADGDWGPAGAQLELAGEERRPVPAELLALTPRIRSRVGIELNPIDITTDRGVSLLKSFVWPDQTWRLEQLDRAIAALRNEPPELVQGDLADLLPGLLDSRRDDALTVVWQTAVLGYLPEDRNQLVRAALANSGATGPLAFVEATAPDNGDHTYYGLNLQLWPDGQSVHVAYADVHGSWIDWLGGS